MNRFFTWEPGPVQRDPMLPTRGRTDLSGQASRAAQRLPWDEFVRRLEWLPGEHVALVGPTGQGKTTLLLNLLPLRQFVTVFATKPKDDSMDRLIRDGYNKIEKWFSYPPRDMPRRVLWPDATNIDSVDLQKRVFTDAFEKIYREGGWCVAVDELWFFVNILKLDRYVRMYLLQARSLGISFVAATQRPVSVPVEVYDQSTHLFFWRDNDRRNLDRLSEINSRSSALVRELVANLERYQVLYVNTRTGEMYRTKAPIPRGSK